MPNCFTLTRIGDHSPATLESVDRALCQHFELDYNPRTYVYGWFDDIGYKLACGRSFDAQVDETKKWFETASEADLKLYGRHEAMMVHFIHFLRQNYIPDTWAERK